MAQWPEKKDLLRKPKNFIVFSKKNSRYTFYNILFHVQSVQKLTGKPGFKCFSGFRPWLVSQPVLTALTGGYKGNSQYNEWFGGDLERR